MVAGVAFHSACFFSLVQYSSYLVRSNTNLESYLLSTTTSYVVVVVLGVVVYFDEKTGPGKFRDRHDWSATKGKKLK